MTSSQRAPCRRVPSVQAFANGHEEENEGSEGTRRVPSKDVDAGPAGHFCGRKVHPISNPT